MNKLNKIGFYLGPITLMMMVFFSQPFVAHAGVQQCNMKKNTCEVKIESWYVGETIHILNKSKTKVLARGRIVGRKGSNPIVKLTIRYAKITRGAIVRKLDGQNKAVRVIDWTGSFSHADH